MAANAHAAPSAPPRIVRWSTDRVLPEQRLDYWVGAICEAFLEMECDSAQRNAFEGSLQCLPMASIDINVVKTVQQEVFRTRIAITRSSTSPFYLITDPTCVWRVRQDGHDLRLRPGDSVLVDASRPYEFHFPGGADCLSVQMPRWWVSNWLHSPDVHGPRTLRADEGWGRAVNAMAHQLCSNIDHALALPPSVIADHLGALLAATFNPQDATPSVHASILRERAELLMAERLSLPQLTAPLIADALDVSPRTLHRAFAKDGVTFLQKLQMLRTQRASSMLRSTAFARLTTAEIGRRCGFPDASHFTRTFKARTGQTPAQWRSAMR